MIMKYVVNKVNCGNENLIDLTSDTVTSEVKAVYVGTTKVYG